MREAARLFILYTHNTHVHAHTHTHKCASTYAQTHTCTQTHKHTQTHTNTHRHTYIHIHAYMHMHKIHTCNKPKHTTHAQQQQTDRQGRTQRTQLQHRCWLSSFLFCQCPACTAAGCESAPRESVRPKMSQNCAVRMCERKRHTTTSTTLTYTPRAFFPFSLTQ